jgi:hypothetical protein
MTAIIYNPRDNTLGCESLCTWGNERCPREVEDKILLMQHEGRKFLVGLGEGRLNAKSCSTHSSRVNK